MPVRYYIDVERDLLVGVSSGEVTAQEVTDAFDTIVEKTGGAAFYKHQLVLPGEQATAYNMGWEAFVRLKECIEKWSTIYPGRNVRSAIVTSNADREAVAKLWQAFADAHPSVGSHVKLFPDEAAAISWLRGYVSVQQC